MDAISLLQDLAHRPSEAAARLKDKLTPEMLNYHPGDHDNSIAWLLWHTAREIDEQVSAMSGREPVWTAQGFDRRFGLDLEEHELGYGHSSERARSIVVEDVDLLFEHLDAVVDDELEYLASLTASDLDDVVDENWDPPVTRAARLVSVSEDALQHIGQATYVTGMRSTFE
ncbi:MULTISPECIES: mycothiol transferase [Micrococcales]|uniref:mycothiol transferase n=1 Tax=Micrococcales TaxID=85006 RepID=UPI0004AA060A|nr:MULTISPECIES: DinB family protein [Micrococcales]